MGKHIYKWKQSKCSEFGSEPEYVNTLKIKFSSLIRQTNNFQYFFSILFLVNHSQFKIIKRQDKLLSEG